MKSKLKELLKDYVWEDKVIIKELPNLPLKNKITGHDMNYLKDRYDVLTERVETILEEVPTETATILKNDDKFKQDIAKEVPAIDDTEFKKLLDRFEFEIEYEETKILDEYVQNTYYKFPKGFLENGYNYKIIIQPRDSATDLFYYEVNAYAGLQGILHTATFMEYRSNFNYIWMELDVSNERVSFQSAINKEAFAESRANYHIKRIKVLKFRPIISIYKKVSKNAKIEKSTKS